MRIDDLQHDLIYINSTCSPLFAIPWHHRTMNPLPLSHLTLFVDSKVELNNTDYS